MSHVPIAITPDPNEGRLETNIKLRVVEAKNIPPAYELKHSRETYVIICLDQEEIFRTATVEKTLCPFYGEDYSFKVPREFDKLSFYLCEPGLHRDSRLGKVSIGCDELRLSGSQEEKWYPIQHVDADSEVQGKVYLSLNVTEKLVPDREPSKTYYVLSVKVIEACGLSTMWSCGFSDPFCQVMLLGNAPGMRSEVRRGSVRKRTVNPVFQETFEFPVNGDKSLQNAIVRVSLWHGSLIGEGTFLGQVNLSVGCLSTSRSNSGWYSLSPRPTVPGQVARPDIGSMRLKVNYFQDFVYPLEVYDPLTHLLTQSISGHNLQDSAMFMLSEVHRDRSAMGRALVRIFLSLNKVNELFHTLIQHEVDSTIDPNTLFRGNSLASKVIDEFMKLVGQSYLQKTLQYCIDEIFDVRRNCEIDPAKLTETDNRDLNMANLLFFIEKILSAITASARSCPRLMCTVFAMLKDAAVKKFPDKSDVVCYTSVSGFVFLRFFAPAILNPRLFNLRPEFPNAVVARTLTLISKSLQSLGNIGGPKLNRSLEHKETYMAQLNMELSDQIENVKTYLTAVSDPRGGQECSLDDMVYREGMLVKRSQGRKRGPKNFRKRFFCLTGKSLTYAKSKGEPPLCTIPSHEMLAVERVDEDAFGMKFMLQVVQPERILYILAKNSIDQLEWLTTLSKSCNSRVNMYQLYHSGAFVNQSWTCCGDPLNEVGNGCRPLTLAVKMLSQKEDIDLEIELHKIYKMFLESQSKLIKLKDEATLKARDRGEDNGPLPARLTNLCELLVFVKNLELASTTHFIHNADRPGSKAAPYSCSSGEAIVLS